ncbi:MAG: S-layer homology domain-containing protein [Oscillospiraceae bacterium]
MHHFKRSVGFLLALTLLLAPVAQARQFQVRSVDQTATAEVAAMLNAIGTQTFSAGIDPQAVRGKMEHFLYGSNFAAFGNAAFPCRNYGGYWGSLSDGTYTNSVRGTGCFAYSKFVSQAVYGAVGDKLYLQEGAGGITAAGLKAFLSANAQAGEHLRADSRHSVTYFSRTEDGFYYTDYGGDSNPYIRLRYTTFYQFAAKCNDLGMRVWLYNPCTAVNGTVATPAAVPAPVSVPVSAPVFEEAPKAAVMQESDWFYGSVKAAEELGLVQSKAETPYDAPMTVAEAATMAARIHSINKVGGMDFAPIPGGTWYAPYVNYLKENGISVETTDYEKPATREQFAHVVAAAMGETIPADAKNVPFADAPELTCGDEVTYLYTAGIISGIQKDGKLSFCPGREITKAEAVAIAMRAVDTSRRVVPAV